MYLIEFLISYLIYCLSTNINFVLSGLNTIGFDFTPTVYCKSIMWNVNIHSSFKLLVIRFILFVIFVCSGSFEFSVEYLYVTYQRNLTADMGLQHLQIIYDSPNAIFTPGQTISGRVLIVVSSSVKIQS